MATVWPEFKSLLTKIEGDEDIGAVVATCGLRRVWEAVLKTEGLS